MKKHFEYEIIGETQDDAVGEAFDKVARILSLGYPGGPAVAQRAVQATRDKEQETSAGQQETGTRQQETSNKIQETNDIVDSGFSRLSPVACHMSLPRPMLNSPDFNFSFSGLKTAVLYAAQKFRKEHNLDEKGTLPDSFVNALCKEFQQAAIDVLVKKTIRAAKKFDVKTVILAGGVSANTELRTQLGTAITKNLPTTHYSLPPIHFSTDNAAMIAAAGALRWKNLSEQEKTNAQENWKTLKTFSNLSLSSR